MSIIYSQPETPLNITYGQPSTQDNYSIYFDNIGNCLYFTIDDKKYWIQADFLAPINENIIDNPGNDLHYQDIYPNVDYQYSSYLYKLKEQIVLKNADCQKVFQFNIINSDNLIINNENNKIVFKDKDTKEIVVEISQPFLTDSNNTKINLLYTLNNNSLILDMTQLLQDNELVYPIIIDPSYTIKTNSAISDNGSRVACRTSDGKLHTCYQRDTGGSAYNICYAVSADGGQTWAETVLSSNGNVHPQFNAVIACDYQDNLHVCWWGIPPATYTKAQIQYKKCTNGTWDTNPTIISSISGADTVQGQCIVICIDSMDNVHVCWHGTYFGNTTDNIRYNKYSGGAWGTCVNLTTDTTYVQSYPSMCIDKNDNIHIAWAGTRTSYTAYDSIRYMTFTTSPPGTIANLTADSSYLKNYPCICCDSNNNLYVLFYSLTATQATKNQLQWCKYNGSSWSSQATINSVEFQHVAPNVSIDGANNINCILQGTYAGHETYQSILTTQYNGSSWSAFSTVITGVSTDMVTPKGIFATHPTISGVKPNIPKTGYAFVYGDGSAVKYYASTDLDWDIPSTFKPKIIMFM